MAWHPVVIDAAGAMGHRRDLETTAPGAGSLGGLLRPRATLVPRRDNRAPAHTGEPVAWTAPMSRQQLDTTIYALTSAAIYLTAALSGMRASELLELTAGCRPRRTCPAAARGSGFVTRRIKGEPFGGIDDAWVVHRRSRPRHRHGRAAHRRRRRRAAVRQGIEQQPLAASSHCGSGSTASTAAAWPRPDPGRCRSTRGRYGAPSRSRSPNARTD